MQVTPTRFVLAGFAALAVFGGFGAAFSHAAQQSAVRLPVASFRVVERESGPTNYYKLYKDSDPPFIRAEYRPPYKTAVMGVQVPDHSRESASGLRWRWRALKAPQGGNECQSGKGDSSAVVYISWRRTLRYYALKYVWSPVAPKGAVCDQKSNPFAVQHTVVLQSGGPLNEWKSEHIDLKAEFRKHFENGDASASVPDFIGVGIMSDGDQTKSESSADYADFVLER